MTGAPRYFLTAYGLALKHGFQGSEEEWLESLTAYGQAVGTGYEGSYEQWLQKIADPVPELTVGQTLTLEAGLPARVEIAGTKEKPILNFGIPRGEGLEDALMRTGGTMSGELSMGLNPLTNLPEPKAQTDAVNKKYADIIDKKASDAGNAAANAQQTADSAKVAAEAALARSGGTMTGSIDMGGQKLSNVPAPQEKEDAANKEYVDSRKVAVSVNLPAAGWAESGGLYNQRILIDAISDGDNETVKSWPVYSGDKVSDEALRDAVALVTYAKSSAGAVTFTCIDEAPTVDIPVIVEVSR